MNHAPCGICGTPVLRTKYGGFAEYHDCKPVPGAMLDAMRAERDKALADLAAERERREKAESVRGQAERDYYAARTQVAALVGLLREAQEDDDDFNNLGNHWHRAVKAALAAAGEITK